MRIRKWDPEESRLEDEAWQADAIARRPTWRKDYENELRSLGLENPGPVEITIPPDPREGEIGNSYRTRIEKIPFLGANIEGVRFGSNVVPSGATIREVMLLTDGDIGRPPCIDAEINGVRLLFRWNGMRPRVQYTSVLTAEEVRDIQEFTGESKGESKNRPAPAPGDSAEDKIIMEAMRTWTGRRRIRHDKYRGAPHLRELRKAVGLKINMRRRNELYLRVKG